ncbi:hypothetical protein AAES_21564 [Amazona aestiva]|uniref:U1-type domain-containing protein n=1 Tax=Amazona aestiva TaxID=12930 RepID=A0A0Q3X8I1_AMAAE|nr:hypothetical protein AAES_21564 [Amazona aestiva]
MSALLLCDKYFMYGCFSVPAAGGCSEGPGTRQEDKGKAKPNSASQQSGTETSPSLPKPGVAAVAPVTTASSSKSTNGAANTVSESEEEKAKKLLYCSLCKVAVNSLSQLEAHNTGSKHKTMVEARNGAGPIKSYPRPGSRLKVQNGSKGSGLQNKTFHCEICDVHVNSEIQLKQQGGRADAILFNQASDLAITFGNHECLASLICGTYPAACDSTASP